MLHFLVLTAYTPEKSFLRERTGACVETRQHSKQVYQNQGEGSILFCTPQGTKPTGGLWFWSYVYYLSKYYEFLDTVLLALKAKPTSFLHVFHHAGVVSMSWLWVDQVQSMQFGGLLMNTLVHVIMYYYYFLTALKISPWWKKYITMIQIIQFASRCVLHHADQWSFVQN